MRGWCNVLWVAVLARTTQTLDQNSDYRDWNVTLLGGGGEEPELVGEVERHQRALVGLTSTSTLLEPDSLRGDPDPHPGCVLILAV